MEYGEIASGGTTHSNDVRMTRRNHRHTATTSLDLFKPTYMSKPELLGKGGYGSVISVVGRLDNKKYALKRVPLRGNSKKQGLKTLREVSILSQLNHPNVVRYHNAWIQRLRHIRPHRGTNEENEGVRFLDFDSFCQSKSDSFSATEASIVSESGSDNSSNAEVPSSGGIPLHLIQGEERLECFTCGATYEDWEVTFEQWQTIDVDLQPFDLCIPCFLKNYKGKAKANVYQKPKLPLYLFIQMEYCEETLNERLDILRKTYVNNADALKESLLKLSVQIAKGLAYLHSVKVIHRDLKPQNIFVVGGDRIKIGDLGGAIGGTIGEDKPNSSSPKSVKTFSVNSEKTVAGTYLYLSPETKERNEFSFSSDIFSFGIVLFEMFCGHNFTTGMERAKILENLRDQNINSNMRKPLSGQQNVDANHVDPYGFPDWWLAFVNSNVSIAEMIMDALQYHLEHRPSAKGLLSKIDSLSGMEAELKDVEKPVTGSFCTSCGDLKERQRVLESRIRKLEAENSNLKAQLASPPNDRLSPQHGGDP